MIDFDALEEQHFEAFYEECCANIDLCNLCYETFADHLQQFIKWKLCGDGEDELVYGKAFEELYAYDSDELISNPIKCINWYINTQNEMKEAKKEWELNRMRK